MRLIRQRFAFLGQKLRRRDEAQQGPPLGRKSIPAVESNTSNVPSVAEPGNQHKHFFSCEQNLRKRERALTLCCQQTLQAGGASTRETDGQVRFLPSAPFGRRPRCCGGSSLGASRVQPVKLNPAAYADRWEGESVLYPFWFFWPICGLNWQTQQEPITQKLNHVPAWERPRETERLTPKAKTLTVNSISAEDRRGCWGFGNSKETKAIHTEAEKPLWVNTRLLSQAETERNFHRLRRFPAVTLLVPPVVSCGDNSLTGPFSTFFRQLNSQVKRKTS